MIGLVTRLLLPGLFGAEIWDEGQPVSIHPEEAVQVAGSGDKRRRDFALGRACARAALAGLGAEEAVIARGDHGVPIWPPGIAGSITHTDGYAAALAGKDFAGIGIDAERAGAVGPDLWPRLFSSTEQKQLAAHAEPLLAATLLFSAKEASYKAWTQKGALTFRDIEITLGDGTFHASRADARLDGRFATERGIVLVAAWR